MKLCILVLLTIAATLPIHGQEKSPHPNGYQKTSENAIKPNTDKDVSPSEARVVVNQETTYTQGNGAANKSESYFSRLIAPENLPNIGLFFAGIAGIIIAICTLRKISGQTEAILRQADIMQSQSSLTIERERPRIFIKFEQAPAIDWKHAVITYQIECLCPTTAFIKETGIDAYIGTQTLPNIPCFLPICPPNTIKENTLLTKVGYVFNGDTTSQIDVQQINSGKIHLYCRGFIEYRGVHLLPKEPSYRTPFGKKWIPPTSVIPTLGDGGYWVDYPDAEANRNT